MNIFWKEIRNRYNQLPKLIAKNSERLQAARAKLKTAPKDEKRLVIKAEIGHLLRTIAEDTLEIDAIEGQVRSTTNVEAFPATKRGHGGIKKCAASGCKPEGHLKAKVVSAIDFLAEGPSATLNFA